MGYSGHMAPDSFFSERERAQGADGFAGLTAAFADDAVATTKAASEPRAIDYAEVARCLRPMTKDLECLWPAEES